MTDFFPFAPVSTTPRLAAWLLAAATLSTHAQAPSADDARRGILTRSPQVKVDKVDHDRLAVHRIDIVDDQGVIRAILAADTPPPIVDGIQYKRAFPAAGLILFDRDGNERGGVAAADLKDGGTAVVAAEDHANGDAIGWRIMPDGSISFVMNERGTLRRDPALGNRLAPATDGATRVKMSVAADGTPAIALADKQDRPRLRLTVTPQGYGAIEFLDADGQVVQTIAPEAQKAIK